MYTDTHTILVAVGMRKMIAFSVATDGTLPVSRSEFLTKNKMLISFTYLRPACATGTSNTVGAHV